VGSVKFTSDSVEGIGSKSAVLAIRSSQCRLLLSFGLMRLTICMPAS